MKIEGMSIFVRYLTEFNLESYKLRHKCDDNNCIQELSRLCLCNKNITTD